MKHAYKYRFYPTTEQAEFLAQTFGYVRSVYNSILRWRTDVYCERKEKIGYLLADARLTALRKESEYTWLNDAPCVPPQQSLRHQQVVFANFLVGRAAYSAFKNKRHKQVAGFTANVLKHRDGELYIAKSKSPLDVRQSRELPSVPSTVTISRDSASRYLVSCLCEFELVPMPVIAKTVGIDMGLKDLFVTDTGFETDNSRRTVKYAKRLTLLQRRLSRKQKGSRNRIKARLKVARLHAKTADCRMDNLHKLSRKPINENQVVCVESLKAKNMIYSPKLSKAIADAGQSELVRQLQYKGKWTGRSVVVTDQYLSFSKCCSCCGFTMQRMPPNVRKWHCPEYGVDHDRDINAARDIRVAGLAVLVYGEPTNPELQHAVQVRLVEVGILVIQGGEPSRVLLSCLRKVQPETLTPTSRYW